MRIHVKMVLASLLNAHRVWQDSKLLNIQNLGCLDCPLVIDFINNRTLRELQINATSPN